MRAALNALRDYQDVLVRIAELDRLLSFVPDEIVQMETDWKNTQARAEELKTRQEKREKEIRESELKLAELKEKETKFDGDLQEVTNNKEYHAVLKEIDTAKKNISVIEEDISGARQEINEIETELASCSEQEKEAKSKFDTAMAAHKAAMGENAQEKGEKELIREKLAGTVPPDLRRKFDRIAARRNGVGLALCVSAVCQSCHVRVRQNIVDRLRRFDRIITCESCKRILFFADTE
ncbi:zinc ribbon domain-containing protein [Acanthopleuribacter pedis]|uniref:C4-type zinc ribbon domain-containing protein n=1 Tax=Acanthopleuribacter pedis TaxID=442870 RepID=A0A8J7QEH6_9BACT|nr:hypothetical protein [Acanthopleuribacter pedis]MBO1316855.1 hypothetical protein [Acanthopleuribacter pedis]